jgi:hypothetical protein
MDHDVRRLSHDEFARVRDAARTTHVRMLAQLINSTLDPIAQAGGVRIVLKDEVEDLSRSRCAWPW